ncbi:MAG TPA: diguanylate cyclase, partial [Bacilli bacterium]
MEVDSEQRFQAIIKHASDVFIILDSHHFIQFVSPAVETMLGYRAEELVGKSGTEVAPLAEVFVMETAKSKKNLNKRELVLKRADGVLLDIEVIQANMLQEPGMKGILITIRDITQKKKAEQAVYHAAFHDYLTDLPNRRMFEEQLDKQLRIAQFYNKKLAVLLIDLDRFKLVNDTLGHSIGDALLKQLAVNLQSILGKGETLYRLGGDEFCIVLDEVKNQHEVRAFSDKVIKIFKKEFIISGYELNITASIGMSLCPEDGETVDSMLKNADTALYFAKSQGRDQAQYYSSLLDVQSFKNFTLSNDLRKALEKNEFFLQYMPRVDTKSTQILGAEALIRWNHADWGMVSPAEFIPIAEESGLIVAIGEW